MSSCSRRRPPDTPPRRRDINHQLMRLNVRGAAEAFHCQATSGNCSRELKLQPLRTTSSARGDPPLRSQSGPTVTGLAFTHGCKAAYRRGSEASGMFSQKPDLSSGVPPFERRNTETFYLTGEADQRLQFQPGSLGLQSQNQSRTLFVTERKRL